MVAARIPSCSVSVMTRSTNFSPAAAEAAAGAALVAGAAGEMLGPGTEPDDEAGEPAAPLPPAEGNPMAAPGAELLPGFAGSPAACLQRSDSESLCSLRQATMRPPPGCTPAHSFCASPAQAARIAAADGGPPACAPAKEAEEIVIDNSRHDALAIRLTFIADLS